MHLSTFRFRFAAKITVLGLLLYATANAQEAGVVFNFKSGSGGYDAIAGLVADSAGNLFGTTHDGGAYNGGVAFELSRREGGWKEIVLHSFGNPGDGAGLFGALTPGAGGIVYGISEAGGSYNGGIAFELTPAPGGAWNETILHSFPANSADGYNSVGNLIRDKFGNLYGTTEWGGTNGMGTVFELSPSNGQWSETILCSLEFSDGGSPYGGLALDARGDVYGVTISEVFELSPSSDGTWTKTVIHTFNGSPDGWFPNGNLVFDKSGNLYGTASAGGNTTTCGQNGCGIVFELSPSAGSWQETIVHNFDNNGVDGFYPEAGVVSGAAGTLYGTTLLGGKSPTCGTAGYNCGTVFALRNTGSGWEEKILVDFSQNGKAGYDPQSALTFDINGYLFGTTLGGGVSGDGTVYTVKP